jgi:5-methylcytosine-specific restriction endonuclease McrA
LRQKIRARDNFVCGICKLPEGEQTHHIHHVDYDKENSKPHNLLTLCSACHSKTNGNRDYWQCVLAPLPLLREQFLSVRRGVRR